MSEGDMRGDKSSSPAESAFVGAPCPTPPKKARRTLVGGTAGLRYGDVAPVLEEVDDEEELREKVQQKIVSKQQFATPQEAAKFPGPGSGSGFSDEQIIKTYESCMKLSADNKINIKNCFGLQLIECLPEITNVDDFKGDSLKDINFQNYGSTIEAGAKIYSYRVDRVHQQVYQVMGTLGRMAERKGKKGEPVDLSDDDEPQTGEAGKAPSAKQKKRKKFAGRTVETNEKNLNVVGTDVEYEDDSLFRKVCSHFDEGGLSGLLLNNVHVTGDGCAVRLHSISAPRIDRPKTDIPELDFTGFLTNKEEGGDAPCQSICPSIQDFEFTKWKAEEQRLTTEEMLIKMTGASPNKPGKFSFGGGEANEDVIPGAERMDVEDFGDDAGFEVDMDDEDNQTLAVLKATTSRLRNDIHSKNLATGHQDYSYFDQSMLEAYAHPSHWQIKAKKEANKQKKSQKARKIKKEPRIDFGEVKDLKSLVAELTLTPAVPVQEKTTVQTTLVKENILDYNQENFNRLSLKPDVKISEVRKSSSRSPSPVEGVVGDYNYNNVNDSLNFCPDDMDESMEGGFDIDATTMPNSEEAAGTSGTQESVALLDKPNKIEKIEINYSKKAKKVDVRKLKREMWSVLTADEADEPSTSRSRRSKEEKKSMEKEKTFADLAAELPGAVSQTMKQNLSVPIMFVCFLHMCNEKALELEGSEDLSNFKIRQG